MAAYLEETRRRLDAMKAAELNPPPPPRPNRDGAPDEPQAEPVPPSAPEPAAPATSFASFVWSFFGGSSETPVSAPQKPDEQQRPVAPAESSDALSPTTPQSGASTASPGPLQTSKRRASILDSALSLLETFVDPPADHSAHAAEMLGDTAGWPTSVAAVDAENESPDCEPGGKASGEREEAAAAIVQEDDSLSPEEEEMLKLEREMNASLENMNQDELAAWELLERENLKAQARQRRMSIVASASRPSPPSSSAAAAGVSSAETALVMPADSDLDPEASQKLLSQLLLDTLPPLKLLDRRADVAPVIPLDLAELLRKHLPMSLREAQKWKLIYSLEQHGISLVTLYRLSGEHPGPVVLGIRNTQGETFGAFLSDSLISRGGYYGTGECFLWKAGTPPWDLQVFRSTGQDEFMIHSENSFLSFGGGDGIFGLWLDSELYHGHSEPSRSFGNETLCAKRDFLVNSIELWGFCA